MLTRNLVCAADSIGMALTDTLDDLISDERINPQLAMKILGNFDQAITEALQKEVKSRLSFKVSWLRCAALGWGSSLPPLFEGAGADGNGMACRAAWTRTASATKSGPS